jgi:caffeoyl-CoA O-methyltransferase
MGTKYLSLNERLYGYLANCRSDAADPVLRDLREETAGLGKVSECQIADEQGTLLSVLVAAIGTTNALEVGTFTGYSSLCIARALAPGGKLICLDQSEEWTGIARRYWARAGVQDRIELRLGNAIALLQKLDSVPTFDFAFIDADKTEYETYYELVLPRVRRNGLIVIDNMLWGGRLGAGPITEASGRSIDDLNHKLAKDPRVEAVLISVADGLQICRKK